MLKISNNQLDDVLELEWTALAQRIQQKWPSMSQKLYPGHRLLHVKYIASWTAQAISACREWGIDREEAVIALATNVLSAATLRAPQSFIVDMSRYFLASAVEGADHATAQEWIAWILFGQHEPQKIGGAVQ